MHDFDSSFADHVSSPRGRDALPDGALTGGAGGAACGDLITIGLTVSDQVVTGIGFNASGCAAATAAASAVVALCNGRSVLDAARVGRREIDTVLGGLSPERLHAAVLAEEALHRALGQAVSNAGETTPLSDTGQVLVAMSGGVDSAVAALLVARSGREAVGATMQLWDDPATDGQTSCCSPQAVTTARRLAHELDMPHFTLDLRDGFRRGVVDPYIEAFERGDTPNPCVGCNGHVRFDALDQVRASIGAATVATGHYARLEDDGQGPLLACAADDNKDQIYMLAAVGPELLERVEFPLGELVKSQVRRLAADANLSVADKAESQDLCFIAGIGRDAFLERHGGRGEHPGDIVDTRGRPLGRHRGAHRFTVGQRRGLGVAAPEPLYVLDVDSGSNAVTVGTRDQLATYTVRVIGVRLLRDGSRVNRVKLRYRNAPVECVIDAVAGTGRHRELSLTLAKPIAGAAPGQIACLMEGDRVLGWATIARTAIKNYDSVARPAKLQA